MSCPPSYQPRSGLWLLAPPPAQARQPLNAQADAKPPPPARHHWRQGLANGGPRRSRLQPPNNHASWATLDNGSAANPQAHRPCRWQPGCHLAEDPALAPTRTLWRARDKGLGRRVGDGPRRASPKAYSCRHLGPKAGKSCHVMPRPCTWPTLEQPEVARAGRSHRPPAISLPPLRACVGRKVSKAATAALQALPWELSGGGPRARNMKEPPFLPSPYFFVLH